MELNWKEEKSMSRFLKMTAAEEATLEETTTEEVVVVLEAVDLLVAVALEATEVVLLQEEKVVSEATVVVHLTDQLVEEKVFHQIVQEEKVDFLKELQDVLKAQDRKLQEQEDREKTKFF